MEDLPATKGDIPTADEVIQAYREFVAVGAHDSDTSDSVGSENRWAAMQRFTGMMAALPQEQHPLIWEEVNKIAQGNN